MHLPCLPTHKQSPKNRTESSFEVYEEISGHCFKPSNDGRGQQPQPIGTTLLPSGRQDLCIPAIRNDTGNTTMPPLCSDEERLQSRRSRVTEGHIGTRSQDTYSNSATIPQKCGSWDDASYVEPQLVERDGRKIHDSRRPDHLCNDGVQELQTAMQAGHTGTSEQQVSEIAIQTELCDTIYVTKDTLVAYTIAVVQNTQSLQYEQIQVVLQMAQNHASIKTPLRAEHLMVAHFNMAILTDNTGSEALVNAQTTETGVPNPSPSTSAFEQEMTCKTPYINSSAARPTKPAQPTGNSNITPLVAYLPWRNHPNRGRGQSYGQGNNIAVWGSNAPHFWLWQSQPYGRLTRSQQALWV